MYADLSGGYTATAFSLPATAPICVGTCAGGEAQIVDGQQSTLARAEARVFFFCEPCLLIAGGGTGGHVFPAIAIAREWLSRGAEREVVLVGTQRGLETKLVPQAGLPLETLRAAGLKGKGGLTLIKNFATLFPGMADAFSIARKHKPVAAFGVGGYAAGPMLLATWLRGIPNVIFEPNAAPGFTTAMCRDGSPARRSAG